MNEDLVVRVQRGDERAFESLTIADYPRLFRVANGVLGDHHLAEDATQQAFLDIWRDIPRLRDPAKYEGWSYRLLVRVCYSEARSFQLVSGVLPVAEPRTRRLHHGRCVPVRASPDWVSGDAARIAEPRTTDAYTTVADRDQLDRGFQRLAMDQRVVLVLHFLLGMTPEQVGETLSISRWTVYSRLDRATKAMRAALEADGRPATTLAPEPQESLR